MIEPEAITEESPSSDFLSIGLGAALQQAREKANLSLQDVSAKLRLSVKQISGLESNDFSVLPDPMITRGFIRNYARLLEIDPQPLLDSYRNQVPDVAQKSISLSSENILISGKKKSHWLPYIIASGVVVVLLGLWLVYFQFFYHNSLLTKEIAELSASSSPKEDASKSADEPMPQPALPVAEREADAQPATVTPETQDNKSPESAIASKTKDNALTDKTVNLVLPTDKSITEKALAEKVASNPAPAPSPAPTTSSVGTAKLKLSFSDESWVSVKDKDGVEIYVKTQPASSEDTINGNPPFRIVIGNAAGVKLFSNGKLVDLTPYTKLNVAKLTLE